MHSYMPRIDQDASSTFCSIVGVEIAGSVRSRKPACKPIRNIHGVAVRRTTGTQIAARRNRTRVVDSSSHVEAGGGHSRFLCLCECELQIHAIVVVAEDTIADHLMYGTTWAGVGDLARRLFAGPQVFDSSVTGARAVVALHQAWVLHFVQR